MDIQAVGAALIRPGQLLTDANAVAAVAQWAQAVTEADGICRVRLTPGTDPCALALRLREQGHLASPNHVYIGQPLYFGGPASRPFPTEPFDFRPGTAERPVTVAVLDTGIAAHPWWNASHWYGEHGADCADLPDASGSGGLDPQAGHGTFIAGLVLRAAPGAALQMVRVLDGDGIGDEAGVLRALGRLRARAPQVLNLSFGGHTFDDLPSPMLAAALAALPETVAVACAGNTATDRPFWPAALPEVVAVGALDAACAGRAPFSAYGPWVDACAPGEWLASSFLEHGAFHGYARWSGTSFATALVSGAIARAAGAEGCGSAAEAAERLLRGDDLRRLPGLGAVVAGHFADPQAMALAAR